MGREDSGSIRVSARVKWVKGRWVDTPRSAIEEGSGVGTVDGLEEVYNWGRQSSIRLISIVHMYV